MPPRTLQVPTADGRAGAFAAFPDHGERHPGVLMYTDGLGIRARAAGDGPRTGRSRVLRARPQHNRALDAAGVDHTCEICPGTVDGFTMSDADAFSPSALQHHWDLLLPLLDRALAGS